MYLYGFAILAVAVAFMEWDRMGGEGDVVNEMSVHDASWKLLLIRDGLMDGWVAGR